MWYNMVLVIELWIFRVGFGQALTMLGEVLMSYPMLDLLGVADTPQTYECANDYCQELIPPARYALGYRVCLACGDRQAKNERKLWCIAPMHKSNYMLITDKADLKGLNNKGGLIK